MQLLYWRKWRGGRRAAHEQPWLPRMSCKIQQNTEGIYRTEPGQALPTCKERFEKNPLRVLDCKEESCQQIVANAPSVLDCLDEECTAHFQKVQDILTANALPLPLIPRLCVAWIITPERFLSLYPWADCMRRRRYDNLVEEIGGKLQAQSVLVWGLKD